MVSITGAPLTSDGSSGNPQAIDSTGNNSKDYTVYKNSPEIAGILNNQPQGQDNPLNAYKTYNYLFTLSILPKGMYNNGDYPSPGQLPFILVRNQGDWENADRVTTEFGQFDYHIDDLVLNLYVSPKKETGTLVNQGAVNFNVTEPYSVGLFAEALAKGGYLAGYEQPMQAVILLAIEFAGYRDDDVPVIDQSLTRYMTLKINNIVMNISSSGSTYQVSADFYSNLNSQDTHSQTKFDHQLQGITVEDFLAKNLKGSLKYALNRAYQQLKTDGTLATTDNIEIKIIDNPSLPGVSEQISKSKLFRDNNAAGSQPQPDLNKVYDKANKVYKENYNVKEDRVMTIPKATPILSAIKEVILSSYYITDQISGGNFITDSMGMINWFIIKTRNEIGEFNPQLNRNNMKWIYEIMPYKVTIDQFVPPGTQPPGYDQIKYNIPKVYDYIYTGKNTEIINWSIVYDNVATDLKPADLGTNTGTSSSSLRGDADILQKGAKLANAISLGTGELSPQVALTGAKELLISGSPGSGSSTANVVNNRIMDQIVNGEGPKAYLLDMTIRGDPFWLANDSSGNKQISPASYHENSDGTINAFSGKIFVLTNFRTPIDLDPATGKYRFAATLDTISGLYEIVNYIATFSKGKFTITFVKSMRLRAQLTTSGQGSGFGIASGQGGGFLSAGATDLLSTALNIFGKGGNVFGSGLSVPNLGGILSGVAGNIGSEIGGAVEDITSAVGDIGSTFGD